MAHEARTSCDNSDKNDGPVLTDEALNDRYQELTDRLLVLKTNRITILMDHCPDERAQDGTEEEIRQHIRERAHAGDARMWEVNRNLVITEKKINELQAEINNLQGPVGARIEAETEDTDFSQ